MKFAFVSKWIFWKYSRFKDIVYGVYSHDVDRDRG